MEIVVQKYGGTSTGTPYTRDLVYDHIQRAVNDDKKVIAVVSAMGRYDDPYATDTLLSLVNENHMTKEELDRLASIGETISVLVMKSEFMRINRNVTTVDNIRLGITTDDHFQNANITSLNGDYLRSLLETYDVVFVPGFQGHDENHTITTLGRGGSDLTAIAIARALNASQVEIYSDVNGVYSGDPRVIEQAFALPSLSFEAMIALAKEGAKVLNHRCVEMAYAHDIEIHARSTFSHGWGTKISKTPEKTSPYVLAGVTGQYDLAMIRLNGLQNIQPVLDAFNEGNLPIRGYVLSPQHRATIMLSNNDLAHGVAILENLRRLDLFLDINIRQNVGHVSLVVAKQQQAKQIYEEALLTLINHGYNVILPIQDGLILRFFLAKKDISKAENLLHDTFFLNYTYGGLE